MGRVITGPQREKKASRAGEFIYLKKIEKGNFWTFSFFDIIEPNIAFFDKQFFENFPHFAPRGEVICDHRMLHFLDLLPAEIYFPMIFPLSLVCASAFEIVKFQVREKYLNRS